MILDDVLSHLQTNSIGTESTDLFGGELPDSPDDVVVVNEYAGEPANNMASTRSPGIQILVRGSTYISARQKIEDVYQLLKVIGDEFDDTAPEGITINGNVYLKFKAVQEPFPLATDAKGRHVLAQNYIVTYKE